MNTLLISAGLLAKPGAQHIIHDNAEEDKASAYSGNKVKTIRIFYTWSLTVEHMENMLGTSIWI